MAKKYCEKCQTPVEMLELNCPSCSGSSFTHSIPDSNFCDCGIPLINGKNCDRCLKTINPSRLKILMSQPTQAKQSPEQLRAFSNNPDTQINQIKFNTDVTLKDLIRAQDRTTHAVRAFVRFLFIQLTGITFAVFLWNLSTAFIDQQECFSNGTKCTGNGFLQFLAAVVIIVSVIWSSQAGWDELQKSNVNN